MRRSDRACRPCVVCVWQAMHSSSNRSPPVRSGWTSSRRSSAIESSCPLTCTPDCGRKQLTALRTMTPRTSLFRSPPSRNSNRKTGRLRARLSAALITKYPCRHTSQSTQQQPPLLFRSAADVRGVVVSRRVCCSSASILPAQLLHTGVGASSGRVLRTQDVTPHIVNQRAGQQQAQPRRAAPTPGGAADSSTAARGRFVLCAPRAAIAVLQLVPTVMTMPAVSS